MSPVVVDGILDDPVWAEAQWQGDFSQLKPSPGEPAGAVTRVAVAFDDRHIYAAFRCLNPSGGSANSSDTARDSDMDEDNAVTLYLDTYHTRRDCYYFSTNSLGTQVDGPDRRGRRIQRQEWDCTWWVVSRAGQPGLDLRDENPGLRDAHPPRRGPGLGDQFPPELPGAV